MEVGGVWSIDFLGAKFTLGPISDFFLILIPSLLVYVVLFGAYVALLHAKGRRYDRKRATPILILLPLALIIGNITKSLILR